LEITFSPECGITPNDRVIFLRRSLVLAGSSHRGRRREIFHRRRGFMKKAMPKYQQISLAQNPDGRIFLDEELILSPDE
jgi:hypothetical protein